MRFACLKQTPGTCFEQSEEYPRNLWHHGHSDLGPVMDRLTHVHAGKTQAPRAHAYRAFAIRRFLEAFRLRCRLPFEASPTNGGESGLLVKEGKLRGAQVLGLSVVATGSLRVLLFGPPSGTVWAFRTSPVSRPHADFQAAVE
jgi:hypothetical protein